MPKITRHAKRRMAQRCGTQGESEKQKVACRAYMTGITHAQAYGPIKQWMSDRWLTKKDCDNMRIYGDCLYMFSKGRLVTVINVPESLKPQLHALRDGLEYEKRLEQRKKSDGNELQQALNRLKYEDGLYCLMPKTMMPLASEHGLFGTFSPLYGLCARECLCTFFILMKDRPLCLAYIPAENISLNTLEAHKVPAGKWFSSTRPIPPEKLEFMDCVFTTHEERANRRQAYMNAVAKRLVREAWEAQCVPKMLAAGLESEIRQSLEFASLADFSGWEAVDKFGRPMSQVMDTSWCAALTEKSRIDTALTAALQDRITRDILPKLTTA